MTNDKLAAILLFKDKRWCSLIALSEKKTANNFHYVSQTPFSAFFKRKDR
jgi:hypothetical protein